MTDLKSFDLSNIPGLPEQIEKAGTEVLAALMKGAVGAEIQVKLSFDLDNDLVVEPSVTVVIPATKTKWIGVGVFAIKENGELKLSVVSQGSLFEEGKRETEALVKSLKETYGARVVTNG